MKIGWISALLCPIVVVSGDALRKCCPPDQTVVEKNSTRRCEPDSGGRVQTNLAVSNGTGLCVDVFAPNKTAVFHVDANGAISKRDDLEVELYPKCCPLGRVYDEKLHTCRDGTDDFLPSNTFVYVGLPWCEVIADVFFSTLEEVEWSKGGLRIVAEDRSLDRGKFCVDRSSSSTGFVVRICEDLEVCERIRCVRKCCPDGQSFVNGAKCRDTFGYGIDLHASRRIEEPDAPFAIIHGLVKPSYILKPNANFLIDKSGTFTQNSNNTKSYGYQEKIYCIEHAYKKGKVNGTAVFRRVEKPAVPIKFSATRWAQMASCVFLALTVAVYLALPKMLNLFGKILLGYCLATFLFFFFLCLAQFLSREYSESVCKLMGYLTIMASLWSFTWLNVMCIDIWVSFGTPRTFSGPLQRNEWKRLIQYSVYGWGVPMLWVLTIAIFNATKMLPAAIHPHVGDKKCYMQNTGDQPGNYAYNVFITFPVLLQQIANIILFVKTLLYCLKIRGEIQRMNASSRKNYRVGKEELNLVMKLAVIMGVFFLFETVSMVYDFSRTAATKHVEMVWDTVNCLQGVFIFVVFVCKRKIYRSLLVRFGLREARKGDGSSVATQSSAHHGSTIRRDTIGLR